MERPTPERQCRSWGRGWREEVAICYYKLEIRKSCGKFLWAGRRWSWRSHARYSNGARGRFEVKAQDRLPSPPMNPLLLRPVFYPKLHITVNNLAKRKEMSST